MAESRELKPRSFRIDDETAEKFKEITGSIGGNQQLALSKLIEVYELQRGKTQFKEKASEIEKFEKYMTAVTRMFMSSLEENMNVTETVQAQFDSLLKSKDTTIQDLQGQLTVAKQQKEESTAKAKTYVDENARLSAEIASLTTEYNNRIENMQSMLADKDKLNRALTDSCSELKVKVDSMAIDVANTAAIKNELDELQIKQSKLEEEHRKLQAELAKLEKQKTDELERAKDQAQLALDKAVFDAERKHQEQIEKIKAEKQQEIDRYQQKYLELLEQIKDRKTES